LKEVNTMTPQETAARIYEITSGMTSTSAAARRTLSRLAARLAAGQTITPPELLDTLQAARQEVDPLDIMTALDLDELLKALAGAKPQEATPSAHSIAIKWTTGQLDILPAVFFPCSCAKLKQLLALAEIDTDTTRREIGNYLTAAITQARQDGNRRQAGKLSQLLAIVNPPRQRPKGILSAIRLLLVANSTTMDGYFLDDGKPTITNGAALIRFNDPVPGLEQSTAEAEGKNPFHAARLFASTRNATQALELPTIQTLGSAAKLWKCTHKKGDAPRFEFPGSQLAVNPEFLAAIMKALPGAVAYWDENPEHIIYFKSPDGEALLMPQNPAA
jgi:hypothetical protein